MLSEAGAGRAPARVAVLVSGSGTNLQALLDASAAGRMPDAQIALVLADKPGVGALERAATAGVPGVVVAPGEGFAQRLTATLAEHRIEVVVLAGYLQLVPAAVVAAYAGRILNVHPSLLPAFGGRGWYGLRVHEGVLERGVRVTGATVHLVTEEFDEGPILAQHPVLVREGDTPQVLQERVKIEAEWVLLPAATQQVCARVCTEEGVAAGGAKGTSAGGADTTAESTANSTSGSTADTAVNSTADTAAGKVEGSR